MDNGYDQNWLSQQLVRVWEISLLQEYEQSHFEEVLKCVGSIKAYASINSFKSLARDLEEYERELQAMETEYAAHLNGFLVKFLEHFNVDSFSKAA